MAAMLALNELTGLAVNLPHNIETTATKIYTVYLTIRPVTRKGYGSIAHEAKPKGEGSNCFSNT